MLIDQKRHNLQLNMLKIIKYSNLNVEKASFPNFIDDVHFTYIGRVKIASKRTKIMKEMTPVSRRRHTGR